MLQQVTGDPQLLERPAQIGVSKAQPVGSDVGHLGEVANRRRALHVTMMDLQRQRRKGGHPQDQAGFVVDAAWLVDALSAGESATDFGDICRETVYERLGIQPGRALAFGHGLGQEFADQLGDRHTALSCHCIKRDRHPAVNAYGQVTLPAFGFLLVGDVRDAVAGLLLQPLEGIIDEVGGPLWVRVETRGEPGSAVAAAGRWWSRIGRWWPSSTCRPLAAPPDWCGASTPAQPTVAAAGTLDGTGVVRMTDASGHRATTAARPWM